MRVCALGGGGGGVVEGGGAGCRGLTTPRAEAKGGSMAHPARQCRRTLATAWESVLGERWCAGCALGKHPPFTATDRPLGVVAYPSVMLAMSARRHNKGLAIGEGWLG